MNTPIPNKLNGRSKLALEFNKMVDALRAMQPRDSDGTLTSITTRGTFRSAAKKQINVRSSGDDNLVWL